MNTTRTFALALFLLALALLVSAGAALTPAHANNGASPAADAGAMPALAATHTGALDTALQYVDDVPSKAQAQTETYTVSSGGIDVVFSFTRDADGVVTSEARTWMLLPDERGYRAYVTEERAATGEFVEVAKGELYDPDADGVADLDEASLDEPRRAAALD